MTPIPELAAQQSMAAQEIDPGVWMFEAADDMGEWAVEQDDATLEQRLAAGRVQATGGGV